MPLRAPRRAAPPSSAPVLAPPPALPAPPSLAYARPVPRALIVAALLAACTAVDRTAPAPSAAPGQAPKDLSDAPAAAPAQPEPPRPAPAPSDSPSAPTFPLARHTVPADDGHPLAVHAKRPADPWASIVLVHGRTWSSLPDFDLQVPGAGVSLMDSLAAAGLAAYAVDLRGYGATPPDPSGFASPAQAAADLAAVLRFVASQPGPKTRPAVLGWSLGARVAALTAQRHPDLAGALVLYGTPCSDPKGRPSTPIRDQAAPARRANTEAAARADFITPDAIDPAVADAFVRAALAADPHKADWRDVEVWSTIDFSRLKAPILAIHGDRDPVVDATCLRRRLAEAAGPAALEVLPGADHAAHLERVAPRFVAAVVAFLDKHVREDMPQKP